MFGALPVVGGILGAIGGAAGTPSSGYSNSTQNQFVDLQDFNKLNKGASGLETSSYSSLQDLLKSLTDLTNAGPGASAVTDANTNANDFGNLLNSFVQNGGLPNALQKSQANQYAADIFAPQRTAMQQSFIDQNIQGQRLAARLGRSGADPVLQAKLATEETRQSQMLGAQQTALASQTAMQIPQQQMNAANALYNVRQNLASQAFNNRSALMTMGQQLMNSERQYRLNAANRLTTNFTSYDGKTGGGVGGAIGGLLAGIGGGAKAQSALG